MKPYSTSGANRYCRILPPHPEPRDWISYFQSLSDLGGEMLDDGSNLSQAPERLVTAGYTYFGQFVDHDLTRDRSSIADALQLPAEEIQNHQTPRLDLSQLYGKGPFDPQGRELYEDDIRLKVGSRVSSTEGPFDVGLDAACAPVIADDRTVENVILRQVVSVFARLHNAAVEQFRKVSKDIEWVFQRARLQTMWQYQWLIWVDYLYWLLDEEVYRSVFIQRNPTIAWNTFSIPVEFSAAAMRFGHSMVRESYQLSRTEHRNLKQLFAPDLHDKALGVEWRIDWGFFFQGASPQGALSSRPIDARITPALHHLPPETIRLFNAAPAEVGISSARGLEMGKLPVRTLLRGAALRLASGQVAARTLHESVLTRDELTKNRKGDLTPAGKTLRDANMSMDTPLWYYILKESEVRYNGNRLGPVGSRIMAECFFAALSSDPNSFVNHPDVTFQPPVAAAGPPIWNFRGREEQLRNLRALFAAARGLP